jgi:PAS domain S-box-containing protein
VPDHSFSASSSRAAWAILAFALVAAAAVAWNTARQIEESARRDFAFLADEVTGSVRDRLDSQEKLLRAAAGFIESSPSVEREEWAAFAARLRIEEYLPGAIGLGYGPWVPQERRAAYEAGMRARGFGDYTIWPAGQRAGYAPADQLEPFRGTNLRPFGFDMLSEATRREALERARDTGEVALTRPLVLVADGGPSAQAPQAPIGTLMVLAVYQRGQPQRTPEERRAALWGWVYHPYRARDLMRGVLGSWQRREENLLHVRVYDGAPRPDGLLWDSGVEGGRPRLWLTRTIDYGGARWTLLFDRMRPLDYLPAWQALVGGGALSLVLFALALSLSSMQRRTDALVRERTAQAEESKRQMELSLRGGDLGLWDLHVPSGRVFTNERWHSQLGYGPGEVPSSFEGYQRLVHPDDLPASLAAFERHLRGESSYLFSEFRARHKDGRWLWMQLRGEVFERDERGAPVRVVGVRRDVTEQQEAAQERRASEVRLEATVGKMREAEALLRESLREKEALVKEVHHRVKNNLQVMVSLLGLQLETATDPVAVRALRDGQERVRSMALIHEQLYQSPDLSRIDLARYVRELVAGLSAVYRQEGQAPIEVRAEETWVAIDTAIPCGLILNELVSNALKYAVGKGGRIHVSVDGAGAEGARTFTLRVADEGPGLPPALDPQRASSLGLKLVGILARQHRGEVKAGRTASGGALFEVTLHERGSSQP